MGGVNSLTQGISDAQDFLSESFDEATDWVAKKTQDALKGACNAFGNANDAFGDWSPGALQAMADSCSGYFEDNGYSAPELGLPFTGGQCDGVTYAVRVTRTSGSAPFQGASANLDGPITSVEVQKTSVSPDKYNFVATNADGATVQVKDVDFGDFSVDPLSVGQTFSIVCESPSEPPGGCGNPAPVIRPGPTPPPDPGPYPDPGPGEGPNAPYLDPGGNPVIPVPPIVFSPGISIKLPDINIGGGGGSDSASPPSPGDRGRPGSSQDAEGSQVEGEAGPGETLTGVLLELLSAAPWVNKTEAAFGTVYRGVAYVFMGGEPGVDLQPEGATVVFPQFFEAPYNSTKWRVCVNVGYRLRVTPYYSSEVSLI